MFAPQAHGERIAIHVSTSQLEGYAAARAGVPLNARGVPELGAPMRNVEVAWENYVDGSSGRAVIGDVGSFQGDTTKRDPIGALPLDLISVTSRGLFFQPHAAPGSDKVAYFVDMRGRIEKYEPPSWPSVSAFGLDLKVETDAAAVGGELIGVGLLRTSGGEWTTAGLARRLRGTTGIAWRYSADTILPLHTGDSGLVAQARWASSPATPIGIAALVADPRRARAWGHFLGIGKGGTFMPAEPLATLFDLGDRPRPCTPSDRAAGVRFSVPFQAGPDQVMFPGMRHPVIVNTPHRTTAVGIDEPMILLTADAVLFGQPASPCIAAWEGEAVGRVLVSALIPGDLSRGWIFRLHNTDAAAENPAEASGAPAAVLEYRPMSCRFDPSARIPESVWNERGTTLP
jgi:hypothetical protein